jgi:signal transduction histidine kinase
MVSNESDNHIVNLVPLAEFDANDLLQMVSNDLLEPLTAVTAMASRIKDLSSRAGVDPSVTDCADDILRSAAAMEQLIRDLQVANCRADAVTSQRHDIGRLIERAVDIFQPLAAGASIDLTNEVHGQVLVSCNAPRLFEALAHLIDTAITFTPAGAFVRISASQDADECTVSVVDNGAGLKPFQRVAGLYIARSIVEAHGGRLWIDSQPGVGSAFYFTLPLA